MMKMTTKKIVRAKRYNLLTRKKNNKTNKQNKTKIYKNQYAIEITPNISLKTIKINYL